MCLVSEIDLFTKVLKSIIRWQSLDSSEQCDFFCVAVMIFLYISVHVHQWSLIGSLMTTSLIFLRAGKALSRQAREILD